MNDKKKIIHKNTIVKRGSEGEKIQQMSINNGIAEKAGVFYDLRSPRSPSESEFDEKLYKPCSLASI